MDTTNFVVSLNLLISTSKWFNSFLFAFFSTTEHRSRTALMLRRYPAGSTCGSGGLGRAILGMVGGMDILEKPGVAGDLSEEADEMELISAREDEFLRDEEVMVEPDLSLREKRPMVAGVVFVAHLTLIVAC